jgi:hypothetical protein
LFDKSSRNYWLAERKPFKLLQIPSSSSSFMEPPATGHHQWSGAKKNIY